MQVASESDAANWKRGCRSGKKFERDRKKSWQMILTVVNSISCVRNGANILEIGWDLRRNFEKLRKSTWQIENDALRYKGRLMRAERQEVDRHNWMSCWVLKKFEKAWKSAWQTLKGVLWYKSSSEPRGERRTALYLVNWITWRRTN